MDDSQEYESELDEPSQTEYNNTTTRTSASKRKTTITTTTTATSNRSESETLDTTQKTSVTSKRKTRLASSRVTEEDEEEDEDENSEDEEEDDQKNNTTYGPGTGSEDLDEDENEETQRTQDDRTTYRSQASMNIGSERFSSVNKSLIDDDVLNTTKRHEELNQTQAKVKKVLKNFKLKYYVNSQQEHVYPVSAKAFFQFETMLFDALGFTQQQVNDPEETDCTKIEELIDFDEPEYSSAILSNTHNLFHQLDFSDSNEPKLTHKKRLNLEQSIDSTRNRLTLNQSEKQKREYDIKTAKIITVLVNGPTRPRKAIRILLSKRNTASFDLIVNDICTGLKIDNGLIKKIYSLKGIELKRVADFFKYDPYFIAVGNDKIYSKDFSLDADEAKAFFANELIKQMPNMRIVKLYNQYTNKKPVANDEINIQQEIKLSKISFDLNPENYPQDLLANYKIGNIIGEGNFAIVRECTDINTGLQFALKMIDLRKCKGKEFMIENELKILRKAKHPNIIKLIEEYRSEFHFYLIVELIRFGDLLDAITNCTKYTEKDAAIMIYNLALAIEYLHSNNIVHRDIKLENILIHKHSNGIKSLKLGDFGLAVELGKELLTQMCGSPIYVAPEILNQKEYGFEVDIWSLGVVAYILLCGFAPFRGETDEDTFKAIKHNSLEYLYPFWDNITENAKDLIRKMLDRNQVTRIKIKDVLKHPWFKFNESDQQIPQQSQIESKTNNLHEEVSRNLSESFRRTSRDPAVNLVVITSLDKNEMRAPKTPALERVDENNEDI